MTKKAERRKVVSEDAPGIAQPATPDTSDLPDSRSGTRLGTLRDAIERAKGRQQAKGNSYPPPRPPD